MCVRSSAGLSWSARLFDAGLHGVRLVKGGRVFFVDQVGVSVGRACVRVMYSCGVALPSRCLAT